jgi:Mn2+/Fe2+ NRAMP family transporter
MKGGIFAWFFLYLCFPFPLIFLVIFCKKKKFNKFQENIKKIHFRLNVQLKNITFAYVIYVSVCVFENSNNTKERTSIHTLKLQRFQVK